MNRAFGITLDDVESVMRRHGKEDKDVDVVMSIFDDLDLDAITKAALYGHEMEQQTAYAHQEIEDQLKAMGII